MLRMDKKRVIFYLGLATVLLFIGGYYYTVVKNEDIEENNTNQVLTPELVDEQKQYESKLEAIEDLKESKVRTAPALYPEHMLDENGFVNPDYLEYEKQRIIDSIYQEGHSRNKRTIQAAINPIKKDLDTVERPITSMNQVKEMEVAVQELGLEHQLFFASQPEGNSYDEYASQKGKILVIVDGDQTVRKNDRLQMRLVKDEVINGVRLSKNTRIYGFVSFDPNRVMVSIHKIEHRPVLLQAFDMQDGDEGIYIKNRLREAVTQEVIGDVIDDINVTGVPQINGIKKIFKRDQRAIKVTVLDNYQLLLGPLLNP